MGRDNISGIRAAWPVLLFLFPGMVIQWLMYMSVGGKPYGSVRQNTRYARSPLMTWVYAIAFWIIAFVILFGDKASQ